MKQIKVPKEVQEIFFEAIACRSLGEYHDSGWLPSLKAIYYGQKAAKAEAFGWRALRVVHPEVAGLGWMYDADTGTVTKEEDPTVPKPKKARKPKVVVPATNPGEKV